MKTEKGKEAVLISKEEMIEDLKGSSKNAELMSDEELEIYYNNEFYIGFDGKEYVLIKEKPPTK